MLTVPKVGLKPYLQVGKESWGELFQGVFRTSVNHLQTVCSAGVCCHSSASSSLLHVAQFTVGHTQKKQLYFTEGSVLRQMDVNTGAVVSLIDLATEEKASMPVKELPLSQQRRVHLAGANIRSNGKLRAMLYAMVCKPLTGYYTLLLYKFQMGDESCAEQHNWSDKVSI